jgi:hypothetical protein
MATLVGLRTDYLNHYLGGRIDGSSQPWSNDQLDQFLIDAITRLWPDFGVLAYDELATDQATQFFDVPSSITGAKPYKISRIQIRQGAPGENGFVVDQATGWRPHPGDQFYVKTRIASNQTFGVYAFLAFTLANLEVGLEHAVSARAASLAFGGLTSSLVDWQRQQTLDTGRVVSYADAVGASAYWERQYQEATVRHPSRIAFAPRASNRSRG